MNTAVSSASHLETRILPASFCRRSPSGRRHGGLPMVPIAIAERSTSAARKKTASRPVLLSMTYAARLLVLAAFLADLERSDADPLAEAAPPNRPPLRDGE